jgi:hypothetical protein
MSEAKTTRQGSHAELGLIDSELFLNMYMLSASQDQPTQRPRRALP